MLLLPLPSSQVLGFLDGKKAAAAEIEEESGCNLHKVSGDGWQLPLQFQRQEHIPFFYVKSNTFQVKKHHFLAFENLRFKMDFHGDCFTC
ncbi:hypothetical protein L1887_28999 [Cichorium endivia]|nr:hypothetical protein L1887_28999 [Cichorium endivia]